MTCPYNLPMDGKPAAQNNNFKTLNIIHRILVSSKTLHIVSMQFSLQGEGKYPVPASGFDRKQLLAAEGPPRHYQHSDLSPHWRPTIRVGLMVSSTLLGLWFIQRALSEFALCGSCGCGSWQIALSFAGRRTMTSVDFCPFPAWVKEDARRGAVG